MRVRVLGGLEVEGLSEREVGSRKARTLLKVLVVARGAPVPVDRLSDILWGDDPPARPTEQVGVLVSRLRAVLGADRLTRTDAGYSLHVDWSDIEEVRVRTDEAVDALARGRLGAARTAAHAALSLVRGALLPDEDGEWVDVERMATHAVVGTARRVVAEATARSGDHVAAVAAAESALAHDPYDEAALRILMRAHGAAGRPASALAAYVVVRDRLATDLGVPPTPETEALHDAIVRGETRSAEPPAAPATLPGRQPELARLHDALDRVASGSGPEVVVVTGEAGMGKTALVDHWRRSVGSDTLVLAGRCDSLGRDLPLQPVVDAIASHLGTRPGGDGRTHPGDPGVLRLFGGDAPASATLVSDPTYGRAQLYGGLLDLVVALADQRTIVLVVDDLHLAGESTAAWIAFAIRRHRRILVVATLRVPNAATLEPTVTIPLRPLDLEAAAGIVGPDRAPSLLARSGGHPLLLAALAADEGDERSSTVRDAVARRVAAIGDDAAATIQAAAILGPDIDLDLLADVLRRPAGELLTDLEGAAAAGLLVERGAGFSFRHELERETLERIAGGARQALVHRDAARVLTGRPAPDPLVVAVHARLGGDRDLAADWFTRAADVALARHDPAAAQAHIDAAIAQCPTPEALVASARLRMATGHLAEAAEEAARAVSAGAGPDALEASGWVAYYRRRYDEALGFADAALERSPDEGLRVSCLALAGRVRHGAGAVVAAVGNLEQAEHEEAPPGVRALARIWLAHARLHQGRPRDALTLLDRGLADPDGIAHPFAPLHGWFARAVAFGQMGQAADALRACDELDAAIARRGEVGERMQAPAANTRAWILRWTGSLAQADALNHEAVDATSPDGVRAEAHFAGLLDLGDGRLLAGDDAGAAGVLDRLAPLADWHGTMSWHQRHRWLLLRARLALRDGDADTAQELALSVVSDARERGVRRYELLARGVAALAGHGGDDASEIVRGLAACAALDGAPVVAALTARAR